MKHWLIKSEPDEFSIDRLAKVKREAWSGVRNYQARNYMRDGMQLGDEIFFYHSNCELPGIVGLCTVAKLAYPDPTQFDPESDYFDSASPRDKPRWLCVDVAYKCKLKRTITLGELKSMDGLGDFVLTRRGNRLSVLPVTVTQWNNILSME
ncbi:MAG: EVE domain-containing protein [Rhodanobacteraceae bacterium]|nr:EVE domain-containing protein [Rhodanobacteraceae bacterium]MBK7044223.1 EVE domain-containing protein [Rhodanobacteraceae bacterium]MBP9154242.1 EVE domain-containing protein [Xanthomonadales bacterium]HQW80355.1 EVE domain-containing protein [Pseudomonadota bacterium]